MANVDATTGVDSFTGTGGGNNTTSRTDEIRFTNQNQLQAGDTLNGGGGTDTLRLDTSIDFTIAGTSGVNTGLRNLEVIWINGAHTATFRSDQFGVGLLADNLTLQGLTGSAQTIVINMVASAPVLNMFSWQFTNWTGGTDIIRVNGTAADERIVVSSQHTQFDGGGGSDTIDYSGWGGGFTLTLNGATWVDATWTSGLTDRLRNVENVLGSVDADSIIGDSQDNFLAGNGGNDTLSGGAGNDTLDGGTGADTMTGGVGDDTFVVDNAGDVVIERATDAGVDLVLSSVTFDASGAQRDGIENIILTGTVAINATGNALNNILVGNSANNVLIGNAGDDTLDGGAGADTMTGGTGSDTFYVDNAGDLVIDRATDPGTDQVFSSVSFDASGTQQDGIENITLTGTANIDATGNALANIVIGNSGSNVLSGGAGNDTLRGGLGADILLGGSGNDLFIAVAADLVAGESIDGGADTDTLRIDGGGGVSLAGVTLTNLEAITLTDTTGTTLTASSAQAGLITSAAGSNDTVNVSDLAFLTTFATPATRAAAFGLIDGLGTKGVENVQWTEGGATNVATQRPGGGILITSTDNGGNTWATSTFTFDGAGNRLEKVTTFDNGQVTTHAFFGDAVVSATTTNIPGANDTTTVLYDAAGRWDSLLITYDAGGSTLYTYDDAGRVDTRTETAVNGFVSEHTYNDANQRVSVTVTDGPANQYTWASSTQTLDPITQKTTQKTVTFDNGNTSIESYTNGVATSIIVTDNPGGDEFAWNTIETVYGQFTRHLYDNGTGIVQGTATGNTIEGANGSNDALIGNGGSDTFVFRPGGGTDRILDFTDGVDTLNLLAFGVDEVADLSAYTVTQQGPHLVLDFGGGDTLRINNFALANLGNDDLIA